MNRMNYKRYVAYLDRGFDIISNNKFDSPEMKTNIYSPQVPNKPRVWDIIESQKNGSQVPTCAASPMNRIDVMARRSYDSIPKGNVTATHQEWHDKTGHNPIKTPISNNQPGKSILSQAGANNVLPYEISPSKRSVRTGAFQGVPVK